MEQPFSTRSIQNGKALRPPSFEMCNLKTVHTDFGPLVSYEVLYETRTDNLISQSARLFTSMGGPIKLLHFTNMSEFTGTSLRKTIPQKKHSMNANFAFSKKKRTDSDSI